MADLAGDNDRGGGSCLIAGEDTDADFAKCAYRVGLSDGGLDPRPLPLPWSADAVLAKSFSCLELGRLVGVVG